jgi:hypothetical protein
VPVAFGVAIKQRAAASPWPSGDPANMQFEMVREDPDGDQAGPDNPLGVVERRPAEPGIDLGAVVDQFRPARERDVSLSGTVLIGECDQSGGLDLGGFTSHNRGQEPSGPEIVAHSAWLRLYHTRVCDAIVRRRDHPENGTSTMVLRAAASNRSTCAFGELSAQGASGMAQFLSSRAIA